MSVRRFFLRLLSYPKRRRHEQELAAELESHVDLATEELQSRGHDEKTARRLALRELGGLQRTAENYREQLGFAPLDSLLQDFRIARRQIARSPLGFVLPVVLLGLGVGATTFAYGLVEAVLVRPLPLPEPQQLVYVQETSNDRAAGGNPARLNDLREQAQSFEAIAGFTGEQPILLDGDRPRRVTALRSYGPYLQVLGVGPVEGRLFDEREEGGLTSPVALLTQHFADGYFGEERAVGSRLSLNGFPVEVVGVLPPIALLADVDMVVPASRDFQESGRGARYLEMAARLNTDATPAGAQAEVDAIFARFEEVHPTTDEGVGAQLQPLQRILTSASRQPLLGLVALSGVVLLVTCLNLAGLSLARAQRRSRESMVRVALGAGVWRLVRLQLVEASMVTSLGAILGVGGAWMATEWVVRNGLGQLPFTQLVEFRWSVALVGVALAALATMVLAISPSLFAIRRALSANLGYSTTSTRGQRRSQSLLVGGQLALSMLLLVVTSLLVRSLIEADRMPLGFAPEGAAVLRTDLSWDANPEDLERFAQHALAEIAAVPGVESVGLLDRLPLQGGTQDAPILVRGRNLSEELAILPVARRAAGGSLDKALGLTVLQGRWPDWQGSETGVVVNQAFADVFLGDVYPVGQAISFAGAAGNEGAPEWLEIVGVTASVRQVASQPERPEVYIDYRETFWPYLHFVWRTSGVEPQALVSSVRDAVQAVAAEQVIDRVALLTDEAERSGARSRRVLVLLNLFTLLTLVLTAVGLYGLVNGEVTRRSAELGLRIALGATPREIVAAALGSVLKVAVGALPAGLLIGIWTAAFFEDLVWAVPPLDPAALVVAAVLLVLVAGVAALLPSLEATRIDPRRVLQAD